MTSNEGPAVDPFYNQSEPTVLKGEAYQAVDGPPISEGANHRFEFYLYCRQQDLWPKEVAGHDPEKEPGALIRSAQSGM
jgi:hypothetical protein